MKQNYRKHIHAGSRKVNKWSQTAMQRFVGWYYVSKLE